MVSLSKQVQWTLTYPATTGPDHGQISEIAGYVNYRSIMIIAISFPVMLSIVSANNGCIWPFQALNGRNSGIPGCSNDLVQLITLLRAQHRH